MFEELALSTVETAEIEQVPAAAAPKNYLDPLLLADVKEMSAQDMAQELAREQTTVTSEVLTKYEATLSEIAEQQVVSGRVIGIGEKEILMDIGFKSEGVVPRGEFIGGELPAIGEVFDVYLETLEDQDGQTILSRSKAEWMGAWNKLEDCYKTGATVTGKVVRRVKGGLAVEVGGIQAFLPGSQVDVKPVGDFDSFLGQDLDFRIVKVNLQRRNIVLSRKSVLETGLKDQRQTMIDQIIVGKVVAGRVKNITQFGAFIDLGGVDGLLHITDMSWGRVERATDIVSVGQMLEVKVIDLDHERRRISLGLKQLTPHPWTYVPERYPVGTVVTGRVVNLMNYGAFVEIEKGVEGLIHVSEMSWKKAVHHPSEVVKVGEQVEAKVLSLNLEERKIGLGLRQLTPDPWSGVAEKYIVGTVLNGVVKNHAAFGVFIQLEEGIEGMIHVSDLSWTRVVKHPKDFIDKGAEVEVRILEVSPENRRISLGLKQMTEDPWPAILDRFSMGAQTTGTILRVLEKGIIVQLEMEVEGIIPPRFFPKEVRKEMMASYAVGDPVGVEIVEVKADEKKVVVKPVTLPEVTPGAGDQTPAEDAPAD